MDRLLFKCRVKLHRHSSKKNEKEPGFRRGRAFIRKKTSARNSENELLLSLLSVKRQLSLAKPIECDIRAVLKFYFPKEVYYTKKGERSKTLPDLSNLYLLPEDLLQKVGIIKNDTQIECHAGSGRFPTELNEYYLEIELYEFLPREYVT